MKCICFTVLLVAVQLSESWGEIYMKSDDVAPYTVIKKAKCYEIRAYPPAKWVCYDHIGTEFGIRQQARSFFALLDYHGGENYAGANISVAAPITVRTMLSDESQSQDDLFQMCVYLPNMYQENPPEPTEDGVFIQERQKLTVAAKQFDHFMKKEDEWIVQMMKLRASLKEQREPNMDLDDFYGAVFDPPHDQHGRPNEVWIVKKE